MEQRDIIKDQIEQAGKVLGRILSDFLGLKNEGSVTESIQVTNQSLKSELAIDIDKMLTLDPLELKEHLVSSNISDTHIDKLSMYLYEVGMHKKDNDEKKLSRLYFELAKNLMECELGKSSTISFERIELKNMIENQLSK